MIHKLFNKILKHILPEDDLKQYLKNVKLHSEEFLRKFNNF